MPFFVTPDGVRLHYQVAGSGKPIVFLHGWSMSSRVWRSQFEWCAREYQTVTLDLRGHGGSGTLAGKPSLFSLAKDVAHFVEGSGLESVTVVGWSLAVSLMLLIGHNPRLPLDSLVLVDGTPSLVSRDDFAHGLSAAVVKRMIKRLKVNFAGALGEFHTMLLSEKEWRMENRNDVLDLLTNERYFPVEETARDLLVSFAREDLRQEVKKITLPTLLMHGARDRICPAGASSYMAKHIGSAETIVFPEAGHAPFLTQPELFNRKLSSFLRSL